MEKPHFNFNDLEKGDQKKHISSDKIGEFIGQALIAALVVGAVIVCICIVIAAIMGVIWLGRHLA